MRNGKLIGDFVEAKHFFFLVASTDSHRQKRLSFGRQYESPIQRFPGCLLRNAYSHLTFHWSSSIVCRSVSWIPERIRARPISFQVWGLFDGWSANMDESTDRIRSFADSVLFHRSLCNSAQEKLDQNSIYHIQYECCDCSQPYSYGLL